MAAMPFFPRLPPLFYLGLLPAICVLWLWADSTIRMSRWHHSRSTDQLTVLSAMNSALVLERISIIPSGKERPGFPPAGHAPLWSPTGKWGEFARHPVPGPGGSGVRETLFPALKWETVRVTPFRATTDVATRRRSLPFWLILGCYLPLWLLPAWWQGWRRRRKWAATSQEPWPGSKVGHFLGRIPSFFYLGLLPLAGLLGVWSESITYQLKWERTPSWGEGEEITAVDSALHFQRRKIVGEIPAEASAYGWHGLWDEAGPEGRFQRLPNRLDGSAERISRFPPLETADFVRKERYVSVAVSRVILPFWGIVLGYVTPWLLLVWWQARRRRRRDLKDER